MRRRLVLISALVPVLALVSFVIVPRVARGISDGTVRVSLSTAGVQATGVSLSPDISGSGRFVVFTSTASNLVTGDTNSVQDVFVRDRDADADGIFDEAGAVVTTRMNVDTAGNQALTFATVRATISADGRTVAFEAQNTNLVAGDTNRLGTCSFTTVTPMPTASSTRPAPFPRYVSA